MLKKIIPLIIAIVLIAVLVACASPAPAPSPSPSAPAKPPTSAPATSAPPAVLNLRYASIWPEQSVAHQREHKPVLDEIEQKSNGRIKFTVFAGATLGGAPEMYDIGKTGKADMVFVSPGFTPGRFPLTDIITFAGAYETSDPGEEMVLALLDRFLYKEYADTQILAMHQTETFYLYTVDKPITKLEELKGLKIRSAGALNSPTIAALGATPVMLNLPDMYTSLQTGVANGAAIGPTGVLSFKLQEVLKHVTQFNMGYTHNILTMNLDAWKKVPDDLKPTFKEAARKYIPHGEVVNLQEDDPIVNKAMLARGGSVNKLTAEEQAKWVDAVRPVVNKWVADMKAKGLAVDEAMAIVREEAKKRNVPFPY